MKVLWLCNCAPGVVEEKRSGRPGSGLWMDRMLAQLRAGGVRMDILCPGPRTEEGTLDENCSYHCFQNVLPQEYTSRLELEFADRLKAFAPDVIHIWGTEYGHTLAMMRACKKLELLDHAVISIQGLCSVAAGHYAEGIPCGIQRRYTFRDFLRRDNIVQQRRKFVLRGMHEVEALQLAKHAIGRTEWDRACLSQLSPDCRYHFCGETLREPFYAGAWNYDTCRSHRIFASSCEYPVKGFHYLLEAMALLVRRYPDVTLAVPGKALNAPMSAEDRLRQSSYQKFLRKLIRTYHLEDRLEFLGSLTAEQMKEQYLTANVFALPSTIENSPNSLGEAMLLGVPAVAADVGGVTSLMKAGEEGFVYQSSAPYMLAHYIGTVFDMKENAGALGRAAAAHARKNHDPRENLRSLLEIYEEIRR